MAIVTGFLAAAALAAGPAAPATSTAQVLPTVYEAGHFYAVPETTDGQRLRLLVDTGGGGTAGLYWITTQAATRLGLKTRACKRGNSSVNVADLPRYRPGQGLPSPFSGPCGKTLLVLKVTDEGIDGLLGGTYLSTGRVWTFDYPAHRLLLEGHGWRPAASMHPTTLGFQRNAKGQLTTGFPRITIRVDGKPLDMLLDTGATAHPTAAGEKASGTPTVKGYGVTSYITTSMLERWHKAHPDWRVVKNGDDLHPKRSTRLIEVPQVEIAGWSVGPVWFTEQPDYGYHVWMASMMDKSIEGTVGGNVFRHFAMTIDYPRETAYFRCVTGCKAAATPPPAP